MAAAPAITSHLLHLSAPAYFHMQIRVRGFRFIFFYDSGTERATTLYGVSILYSSDDRMINQCDIVGGKKIYRGNRIPNLTLYNGAPPVRKHFIAPFQNSVCARVKNRSS